MYGSLGAPCEGFMWNSIRLCCLSDVQLPVKSFFLFTFFSVRSRTAVRVPGKGPLRRGGGREECRLLDRMLEFTIIPCRIAMEKMDRTMS